MDARQKENLLQWLAYSMAIVPSVVFYLAVPFTWNYLDSFAYLTAGLRYAVPHFPPLYNGICRLSMIMWGNRSGAVYQVILLQHIVYVSGLIYAGSIFKRPLHKLLFFSVFAINVNVLLVVNGVYAEGFFVGWLLIFWGALCKLVLNNERKITDILIGGVSLACLALTKHIGALWFALPLAILFFLAFSGSWRFQQKYTRLVGRFAIVLLLAFCLVQVFQRTVFYCFDVTDQSKIGRAGIYRIKALPWDKLDSVKKEALLEKYTSGSNDPVLKETFRLIIESNNLWIGPHDSIDSILSHTGNPRHLNADDYFNEAYYRYLKNFNGLALSSLENDIGPFFTSRNESGVLININTLPTLKTTELQGADFKDIRIKIMNRQNCDRLEFLTNTWFSFFPVISTRGALLVILVLVLFLFRRIPVPYLCLVVSLAAFSLLYILASSLSTIFINRYAILCQLLTYTAIAMLLPALTLKKGETLNPGEDNVSI